MPTDKEKRMIDAYIENVPEYEEDEEDNEDALDFMIDCEMDKRRGCWD